MNISAISDTNFKGYDARPVRGFLMSYNLAGIADEMKVIGKKEGFRVFIADEFRFSSRPIKNSPMVSHMEKEFWAQDICAFYKNKFKSNLIGSIYRNISKYFNLLWDNSENHIAGGNSFLIKDGEEELLLVGKNELSTYSLANIEKMFNTKNILALPQMDYHLDLFIRPLANKNILLADDNMTLEVLREGKKKVQEKLKEEPENEVYINIAENIEKQIRTFITSKNINMNPQANQIANLLTFHGFNVIRVPGRIYRSNCFRNDKEVLVHSCNYINANVCINPKGDLVYITNKSNIDENLGLTKKASKELDFSFEKAFIKSLSPYIKPEHIYFVKGEYNFVADKMLSSYLGGIHCACAEIPKDIFINDKNK